MSCVVARAYEYLFVHPWLQYNYIGLDATPLEKNNIMRSEVIITNVKQRSLLVGTGGLPQMHLSSFQVTMNHRNAQTSMSLFGYVAASREEGCTHVCMCVCIMYNYILLQFRVRVMLRKINFIHEPIHCAQQMYILLYSLYYTANSALYTAFLQLLFLFL